MPIKRVDFCPFFALFFEFGPKKVDPENISVMIGWMRILAG